VVYRITQDTFKPLPSGSPYARESLVVHKHASVPETTQNVLFVHGLNGSRYTTWGKFPSLFFEDHPSVDLALYDYASGLRRIRRAGSVRPEDQATLLAEAIREEDYAQTVLIGHSMGGLLCVAAVRKMIESEFRTKDGVPVIDRIAGMILMATPLAGSLRARRPLSWLSCDGRILAAHSQFVAGNQAFNTNKLVTNCTEAGAVGRRHCVPTYAVTGFRDKWADRYSSVVGIPDNQIKHVGASHTQVTKPSGREDDVYDWARLRTKDCLNHIARCPSRLQQSPAPDAGKSVEIPLSAEAFERMIKLAGDNGIIIRRQDWGS
jgi:pimeloyl-ACP methyl ester carboxylesterase